MHFLDTVTVVLAGTMVGNEWAVTAFFNPAVRQLESTSQARGLSILARSLGRVMPIWYGLCFALLGLETFLHHREAAFAPLLIATVIWAVAILFSITALVPINNRVARLNAGAPAPGWKQEHKKWDSLHRARVVLLLGALFALVYALVR